VTQGQLSLVVADTNPAEFVEPEMLRLVRQHHDVVHALFQRATVLPLRFGTLFAHDDAAREMLRLCHDEAVATLAAVADHREWGVRVRRPGAAPAQGLSGTEYLAMRRRERDGVHLHQRLVRHASRCTIRRGGDLRLDAVYLVPRIGEKAFLAEVARIDGEVDTTGPWPPYSFSELRTAAR
jgi:Gas vesicle synthesis protein GvpL/GvpF